MASAVLSAGLGTYITAFILFFFSFLNTALGFFLRVLFICLRWLLKWGRTTSLSRQAYQHIKDSRKRKHSKVIFLYVAHMAIKMCLKSVILEQAAQGGVEFPIPGNVEETCGCCAEGRASGTLAMQHE